LIYPSADTIEDRVGSRYSLVVLAAKRAKQIKEGSPHLIDTLSTNPLTVALEEIAAGKVTIAAAAPSEETKVAGNSDEQFEEVAIDASLTASKNNESEDIDASDGQVTE
jgi:DNA-directed RNA polymerase subunit omega